MDKMNLFMDRVVFNRTAKHTKDLRDGQIYFLSLTEVDSPLAETLRGSDSDCFYVDKKIPLFIEAIKKAWGV